MTKPKYAAGLCFIASEPTETVGRQNRAAIKGHATKASRKRRQAPQLRSWIDPHNEVAALGRSVCEEPSVLSSACPRAIGAAFSGLQLPSGFEPCMIQELVRLIDVNKHGMYPHEICLDVHVVERGWFPYMLSDACCLHSLIFSAKALQDGLSLDRLSRPAYYHYAQTVQLLQARLHDLDRTSATSDATIMVVTTLAAAAELTEDYEALANHVKGLEEIVKLRGGVQALNTHNNMQVKVCRTDLAYALLTGRRPLLLRDSISWDCFVADRGLAQCHHQPHDAITAGFIEECLNTRLRNILRDLHAFSCLSNLAYQTTRKLSPAIYNEMMVSILYRLTNMSIENDAMQEAVRLGLLVFASTIFMQRQYMEQQYDHLLDLYDKALLGMRHNNGADLPASFSLWLTLLPHQVGRTKCLLKDWRIDYLYEIILPTGVTSWEQARGMLISVAWVGFIHDRPGKQAFESAKLRQQAGD